MVAKKVISVRLDEKTINLLDKLVKHLDDRQFINADLNGFNHTPATRVDLFEILINQHYKEVLKEGYDLK
jgi:hypothetical protein